MVTTRSTRQLINHLEALHMDEAGHPTDFDLVVKAFHSAEWDLRFRK